MLFKKFRRAKKEKKPKVKKEKKKKVIREASDMNFWGHIEELRKRIIWAFVFVVLGCVGSGIFIEYIIDDILLQPALLVKMQLQNLRPFGQPFLYFKVVLVGGIILAFPFILFQLWKFISPGLYKHERRWVRRITFFTSICFFAGVGFAYFVMIPSMLNFAVSFGNEAIKNNIDVNEYLSFVIMILLASGLLFEMPMVTYVLSRFGLITPKFMRKYRRHAIVLILILAAVLTPTPDPISQMIFAAPLFVLYELSIMISRLSMKKEEPVSE